MKKARGFTVAVLLAVLSVAGANSAAAQGECRYDVTGDYTFDPDGTPDYLFFGDGRITYDPKLVWHLDDVSACVNVYNDPRYLPYFPKCDIDGDGSVALDELYGIYFRVHPRPEEDPLIQSVCVESLAGEPYVFCPASRYARTQADIEAIVSALPATETIQASDAVRGRGHRPSVFVDTTLNCVLLEEATTWQERLPYDLFDGYDFSACYLTGESFGSYMWNKYGQLRFDHPTNLQAIIPEFNEVAAQHNAVCKRWAHIRQDELDPGFHISVYQDKPEWWQWRVRTTAQCHRIQVGGSATPRFECDCDMTYDLWTHRDRPGTVWTSSSQNNSNAVCNDVRFGGTGCPDSDWDSVCDADDLCPNQDETPDRDGDGSPDCVDQCPSDPTKTERGVCSCDDPDYDGDGVLDCLDPCPYHAPDDPDGDGLCGVQQLSQEELCIFTGGTWENQCGHWPCGMQPWCDSTDPGCRCAMGANFDPALGCVNEPACQEPCELPYDDTCGIDCGDDSDGDGTIDCDDRCPFDYFKTEPGSCGCGTRDRHVCGTDECPNDPEKTQYGMCGCGVPDVDSDGDWYMDCTDDCPADPNKYQAGFCGCGVSDVDSDHDGLPDCIDDYPADPLRY